MILRISVGLFRVILLYHQLLQRIVDHIARSTKANDNRTKTVTTATKREHPAGQYSLTRSHLKALEVPESG